MSCGISLSYRRDDSADVTGRLHDYLRSAFHCLLIGGCPGISQRGLDELRTRRPECQVNTTE